MKKANIPYHSNILLIGGTEKHIGKTTLSVKIVEHFKQLPIYAVKVTVLRDFDGKKGYSITEETDASRPKDTGRLLKAGAQKVLWVKTDEAHAEEAVNAFLELLPDRAAILCESNTIRRYFKPGLFLMVTRINTEKMKKTAEEVMDAVDTTIISSLQGTTVNYDPDPLKTLQYLNGKWELKTEVEK